MPPLVPAIHTKRPLHISTRSSPAGTEQLAIACAFITDGGVEALRPHAQRLRLPRSYIVIAWSRRPRRSRQSPARPLSRERLRSPWSEDAVRSSARSRIDALEGVPPNRLWARPCSRRRRRSTRRAMLLTRGGTRLIRWPRQPAPRDGVRPARSDGAGRHRAAINNAGAHRQQPHSQVLPARCGDRCRGPRRGQ
jgi:hypothetical protein